MPTCFRSSAQRNASPAQRADCSGDVILSGAARLHGETKSKDLLFTAAAVCALLLLASALSASAQVLARPGWAGSGVSVESWWRRAVFYRIDVTRFQDSTGSGRGDLAGVTQRLDYLQSLGIDALVLNVPGTAAQAAGPSAQPLASDPFDDLTRQAAGHHLRVLVTLTGPASARSDATARYLARAREWLNHGAAGLYIPSGQLAALNNPALAAYLVHTLRAITDSFPGERILLADTAAGASAPLANAIAHDVQLSAAPALSMSTPDAASLRRQMLADLPASPGATTLLLASRHLPANLTPRQESGLEGALAAVLLASRTAVLIDYGQELGEQALSRPASANAAPLMQWTPTNLTRQPKRPAAVSAKPSQGVTYGAFHPYIKPLPRNLLPPPPLPDVVLSDTPPPVDPNSLPGFTSGDIAPGLAAAIAANAAWANAAVEDADPHSLLNLYRRLIQLHHENASLRNGAQDILDYDADDALLWLRRPPAGSRTSATVLVACNLSGEPFALSPGAIAQLHLRRGPLRSLLSTGPQPIVSQQHGQETTGDLTISPYDLFLGELRP